MAREFDLLSEVLHEDVLDAPSGRKAKEIATIVSKPYVTLMNELKGQPKHKVDVDLLLPLMLHTGSKRPLHFLAERMNCVVIELPTAAKGMEALSLQAIQTVKEVGELMGTYHDAAADGVFVPMEKRVLREKVYQSVAALVAFGKSLEDA